MLFIWRIGAGLYATGMLEVEFGKGYGERN